MEKRHKVMLFFITKTKQYHPVMNERIQHLRIFLLLQIKCDIKADLLRQRLAVQGKPRIAVVLKQYSQRISCDIAVINIAKLIHQIVFILRLMNDLIWIHAGFQQQGKLARHLERGKVRIDAARGIGRGSRRVHHFKAAFIHIEEGGGTKIIGRKAFSGQCML